MAEDKDESQEKTQDPTSRRLEKAKEDGKVVSSKEMYVLSSIIMMLAIFYFFSINFGQLTAAWKSLFLLMDTVSDGESLINGLKMAVKKIFIFIAAVGIPILLVTILTQSLV